MTARRCFYIQKTLLQNNKKTVVRLANVFDITSCFRLSLPCGGRLKDAGKKLGLFDISIHALRGEGDIFFWRVPFSIELFQSTPSVGRATNGDFLYFNGRRLFQSTPSVGRATCFPCARLLRPVYFNPRPPWGGRRHRLELRLKVGAFQSTPSVGRATSRAHRHQALKAFQSTPSVGRATKAIINPKSIRLFQSTPSVGRATLCLAQPQHLSLDFNPRPPWGGRRSPGENTTAYISFQSTPSVGRATRHINQKGGAGGISIHALRGEGDNVLWSFNRLPSYFNPRPPWGGRRLCMHPPKRHAQVISIHALRGEGDGLADWHSVYPRENFNPRPPWGGRRFCTTATSR